MDSERFIPNTVSPKFQKLYLRTEEDILSLDVVSTKNYIDLFISNSLLINNRKLRRKLESMLEGGNFASVEYLDDLAILRDKKMSDLEVVDSESLNEEIDVDTNIQLEYTDMIRDYINGSKYDSDKIKNGVIQEFNEVVRIYEDNYKVVTE
jgi:hypothetical protein